MEFYTKLVVMLRDETALEIVFLHRLTRYGEQRLI
jgi:hypothetical protein